jgi:Kef-type K+ transport system membrane component KefB
MPSLPLGFLIVAISGVIILALLAAFLLGTRFGPRIDRSRADQMKQLDRSALLRQGLRLQATITNIRSSRGGTYITTAAATDFTTGQLKLYTQRSTAVLGHPGDPITILVDPAHPHVYLMVRSTG